MLEVADPAAFQAAFDPGEDSPDPLADAGHDRHHPVPIRHCGRISAMVSAAFRRRRYAARLEVANGPVTDRAASGLSPAPAPAVSRFCRQQLRPEHVQFGQSRIDLGLLLFQVGDLVGHLSLGQCRVRRPPTGPRLPRCP